MKKFTLPVLGALTLACSSVFAVDGTITVNGVVTDDTCTLRGNFNSGGLKDIKIIGLPTVSTSRFTSTNQAVEYMFFDLELRNATGGACDTATSKAFKGIHLSVTSPDHLDATDKTLLVNQAKDASVTNPVFFQMKTENGSVVDFSAPWGDQAKGVDGINVFYYVGYFSKTGIVDAQTVTATINYTIHYN